MSKQVDRMAGAATVGRRKFKEDEGRRLLAVKLPPDAIAWIQEEVFRRKAAGEKSPDFPRFIDQGDVVAEAIQAMRDRKKAKK